MPATRRIRAAVLALAGIFASPAASAGFCGGPGYDLCGDDRQDCPRSVDDYGDIVGDEMDPYGFCRNARHLLECLAKAGHLDIEGLRIRFPHYRPEACQLPWPQPASNLRIEATRNEN